MQKVLKFLEANVQWVAIGIAALFLGWMIYGYVIQKPITSSVAGSLLTPGEIDPKIVAGPALHLQAAMQNASAPQIVVNDFVTPLQQQLTNPPIVLALSGPWSGIPLPAITIAQEQKLSIPNNAVLVTALPDPAPAPINLQFSQGRSNVTVPDAAAIAAAAASGAAPAAGAGTPADKNWVTVGATIPVKDIAKSFDAKNIPAVLSSTTILRVELVREEQDSSGNWGPEQTIAPLPNVQLMPLPAKNSPIPVQQPYVTWAETNQVSLLQPPFYTVLQADPWYAPGTPPPAPAVTAPQEPPPVDPEKQKELDAAARRKAIQQQHQQQQQQQHGPARVPGPPGAGGGYRPGASPDIFDSGRPIELAQAPVPYNPNTPPPVGGFTPYPYPPQFVPPSAPGAGPAAGSPGALPSPSTFDPHNQADVNVWAHDDTVQPGHTYRYYIRYTIANPVRSSNNACNPPNLADIFSITSKNSDWTAPISVKSEKSIYAITTSPGRESVKFEIFRWKNGAWQSEVVDAEPGDMVGTPRGIGDAKVDFTTGLTLVAVRSDPKNSENRIIILTGEDGQLIQHDLNADRNSDDYKKLKEQSAPKPTTPPANPQAAAMP